MTPCPLCGAAGRDQVRRAGLPERGSADAHDNATKAERERVLACRPQRQNSDNGWLDVWQARIESGEK